MTIEHAPSTNGHVKHAETPAEAKVYRAPAERVKSALRVRARKLALPLILLFGVLMVLRYFEQTTAD